MPKNKDLPLSLMHKISGSGVFVKHFIQYGKIPMRPYAHRDDYYIIALLTDGSAAVEIDFERLELKPGNIVIVSPWQVHRKPADEEWHADGWILAFSPELLSETEVRVLEEYSISLHSLSTDEDTLNDIVALCSMLERNSYNDSIANAIACAIKSMVLSLIGKSDRRMTCRYMEIVLNLKKLLDQHLVEEKRPSKYASMMNISEVYLNEAVKAATGLSVGAYIRSRVLIQAKRFLVYTTMTAKEIAYSLGYDDYAYFSRMFRKYVGISPSVYPRNLK